MNNKHGLSLKWLNTIKNILAPYAAKIESVGLFGSRATGNYRNNSDIDMIVYGNIDEKTLDRLRTLLNDSNLPVTVDIHAYKLITHLPLKKHIDDVMQTIFTREELITAEKKKNIVE